MGFSLKRHLATALRSGPLLALFPGIGAAADLSFFHARVAPVFEQKCVSCHGAKKDKGDLRLDDYERAMTGGESGPAIAPGDPAGSELFRRITLPEDHDDVMPSDGEPLLSADEIRLIEVWIQAGASATAPQSDFPDAPVVARMQPTVPLAPDWRPFHAELARLQAELGVKLVPRSQTPTDGLVLRTASAPRRCDDATLAALAPVAVLIVEAELARTGVTDAGLPTLATFANLRKLDLTRTAVTSAGLAALSALPELESLNLTATAVDDAGLALLQDLPALKHVWHFGAKVAP